MFKFKFIKKKDQINNEWMNLTFRSLWAQISEEAQSQYNYEIKM